MGAVQFKECKQKLFHSYGRKLRTKFRGGKKPNKTLLPDILNLIYDLALIFLQQCNE